MKDNDPFESDPEFSAVFKHCGLSVSLTVRVSAQDYVLIPGPDQENTQRLYQACCTAIETTAREAAAATQKFHSQFSQALDQAALQDLFSSAHSKTPNASLSGGFAAKNGDSNE